MPQYPLNITEERAAKLYGIEVQFPAPPLGVPVVDPSVFQLTLPTTPATVVGTCTATNSPTSWAIVSGSNGDFTISSGNGQIIVTSSGAANLVPETRYLVVSATNATGTGENTITIEIT